MSLDPVIANPATIKYGNPIEDYSNYLRAAFLQDKIADAKSKRDATNAMNRAYAEAIDPTTNQSDPGKVRTYLATHNLGSQIPSFDMNNAKIDKMASDVEKDKALSSKARMESLTKALSIANSALDTVTTPEQYFAKFRETYNVPEIQQHYKDMGLNLEQAWNQEANEMYPFVKDGKFDEFIRRRRLGLKDSLEKIYTTMKAVDGKQMVVAIPKYSDNPTATDVPGSERAYTPKVPDTTVNVNNIPENAGAKVFNQEAAKDAIKDYSSKRAAAENAPKIYNSASTIAGLLDKGAMTGAGSDFATNVLNAMKSIGATVNDDKLEASQALRKYLAENIFNLVTSMKSSGLPISRITNMELELAKMSAPSADMSEGTIRALLKKMQENARDVVISHNRRFRELSNNKMTSDAMQLYGHHELDIPGIPPAAVQKLRTNPNKVPTEKLMQDFDKTFNLPPGTARELLGGTPNGGNPFTAGQ